MGKWEESKYPLNPAGITKSVLQVFCNFSDACYDLFLGAGEDVFLKQDR